MPNYVVAAVKSAAGTGDLGEDDNIIPVDHAYSALEVRPDCRLEILPGVGHFAQVEAPTEVVDLIDGFVSTTAPDVPHRGHV